MANNNGTIKTTILRIILIAVGVVFGAGMAWGINQARLAEFGRNLDKVGNNIDDHENRIRQVEKAGSDINAKLDYLIKLQEDTK